LKKFRRNQSPLEKVLKLFIRKIETRHGVKKTILLNFTLVNSLKLKNTGVIVTSWLSNTGSAWDFSHRQFVNHTKEKYLFFSEKLLETYDKKIIHRYKIRFTKSFKFTKK